MPPALPVVKAKECLRALERAGLYIHHSTGSHARLFHRTKPALRVTVPIHNPLLPRARQSWPRLLNTDSRSTQIRRFLTPSCARQLKLTLLLTFAPAEEGEIQYSVVGTPQGETIDLQLSSNSQQMRVSSQIRDLPSLVLSKNASGHPFAGRYNQSEQESRR